MRTRFLLLLWITMLFISCSFNGTSDTPLIGKDGELKCAGFTNVYLMDGKCIVKTEYDYYLTVTQAAEFATSAALTETANPSTATPTKTNIPTRASTNTIPATLTTAPIITPVPSMTLVLTKIPPTRTNPPSESAVAVPADSATALPTDTSTVLPADTLVPTDVPTATEEPNATSKPYNKPVDPPTSTVVPSTATEVPNTPRPTVATNTPRPTESGFVTPTR